VVFALDRAGIVGADGPTHAGAYDIPFVRCIPNMSIACPADEAECYQLLSTAYQQNHPVAVRYPRGSGAGTALPTGPHALQGLPFGKGELRRQGQGVAILAFGTLLYPALQAGEALNATVANMRWAKPLDETLVLELARNHELLVTVEEGAVAGGAGSAVQELLQAHGVHPRVLQLGLPDRFIEHGDPAKLLQSCGLDAEGIRKDIQKAQTRLN
jgi:1-deoxy-D-xylulose-5-phosphate synthase